MPTDEKPSRNEDEYFAKQNLEIIHEMRAKLDAERRKKERAAHLMTQYVERGGAWTVRAA